MNKRNLQKELDGIIQQAEKEGKHPKLLLHVCCAPCASYCLEYLSEHFDITVLYANSNIDDPPEYQKRTAEVRRLVEEMPCAASTEVMEGTYDPGHFHELVKGHEKDPEGGERCGICFEMRLRETARIAREKKFDYFATSLTISPLKDAERLCRIGEKAGEEYGIPYLPSDFKKKGGYQRSVELSGQYSLYRQNYCGCSFSKASAGQKNIIFREENT